MGKKNKSGPTGPSLNPWKIGITICRIICSVLTIYSGYIILSESGERTYNKYLHSLRKMHAPKGKPSDASPFGMNFDEFFKLLIKAVGFL